MLVIDRSPGESLCIEHPATGVTVVVSVESVALRARAASLRVRRRTGAAGDNSSPEEVLDRTLRVDETIRIGSDARLMLVRYENRGAKVFLGIDASREWHVVRSELLGREPR